MITSQEDRKVRQILFNAYEEWSLLLLSKGLVIKKKVTLFFKILKLFQMISFLIPPDDSEGLPWNYSDLRLVWMGLGIVTRIHYPAYVFGFEAVGLILPLISYVVLISLHLIIFFRVFQVVSNGKLMSDNKQSIMHVNWIKAENVLRFITVEILYLPTLMFLRMLIMDLDNMSLPKGLVIFYIVGLSLLLVYTTVTDSLFLQQMNWTLKSYYVISIPRYLLLKKIGLMFMMIATAFIPYSRHYFIYCSFLVSSGLFAMHKFTFIQPFYYNQINIMESFTAAMPVLSGLILVILKFNNIGNQENYAATAIFFLTLIPTLYIIQDYMRKRRINIMSTLTQNTNMHQYFLQLYSMKEQGFNDQVDDQNLTSATDIDNIIKLHMTTSHKNGFIYIWTLYYKMHMKEWLSCHILLSESRKVENLWETGIYLKECKRVLMHHIENSGEEWEAHSYMMYREHVKALLNDDENTCKIFVDFIYELLSRNTDSSKLSIYISRLLHQIHITKDYYLRSLRVFERNADLLDYYAGYLDYVENSFTSKDIYMRASKAREEQNKKSAAKLDEVMFFNSNNLVLTIDLEPYKIGQIVTAHNTSVLGYADYELEAENFVYLIPKSLKELQNRVFSTARDIWSAQLNYNNTRKLFLIHRNGFMISVYMKNRLVNTDKNKLYMISGIRINHEGYETAILTEDGRFISSMVIYIQTEGMAKFLSTYLNIDLMHVGGLDIFTTFNIKEWKVDIILCINTVYAGVKQNEIKAKTAEVWEEGILMRCILLEDSSKNMISHRHSSDIIKSPLWEKDAYVPRIKFDDSSARGEYLNSEPQATGANTEYLFSSVPASPTGSAIGKTHKFDSNPSSVSKLSKDIREDRSSQHSSTAVESQYATLKRSKKKISIKVGKFTKTLKVGLMIIFLMMVISCLVIYDYLKSTISDSHQGTQNVVNLTHLTMTMADLSYNSKLLYDFYHGIPLNTSYEAVISNLQTSSKTLKDAYNDLRKTSSIQAVNEAMNQLTYPWWYYERRKFEHREESLLNIISHMNTLTQQIIASTNIDDNNIAFMELYRNCPAETFRSLNYTLNIFEDRYKSMVDEFVLTVNFTLVGGMLMLAIFQCTLLFFITIRLHKLRRRIWNIIQNCPRNSLITCIIKLKERLTSVHGEELDLNEKYEHRKSDFIYKNHYCQKILYGSAIFLVCISAGNIIYINYKSLPAITEYLNEATTYNKWTGLQASLSMFSILWIREIRTNADVINSEQYIFSPSEQLYITLDQLDYAHKMSLEAIYMTQEIRDIYYDKYGDGYLMVGLHPGVLETIESSKNIAISLNRSNLNIDEVLKLGDQVEIEVFRMVEVMKDVIDIIFNSSQDRIDAELADMLMFLLIVLFLMFAFMMLAIYPVLDTLKRKMQDEIQVLMYLPREDLPSLLRLFGKI